MSACMICTTHGFPLISLGNGIDWKVCAKLVASIAILITKDECCEFLANNTMYYVFPVSHYQVYYCVIIDTSCSRYSNELKLRTYFLANTAKVFLNSSLLQLVEYYDKKTSLELQNSTFDSLVDDREDEDVFHIVFNDGNVTKDAFRVFEDYFLKPLTEVPPAQCALQHCFKSLSFELSSQSCCTLHLCRRLSSGDFVHVYTTDVSGDNNDSTFSGMPSQWLTIINKHSGSTQSLVYQIHNSALLVSQVDNTLLALTVSATILTASSILDNTAALRKHDPSVLPVPLLTAWNHTILCLKQSLPAAVSYSSYPTEYDLRLLFHEASTMAPAEIDMPPPTIDTTGLNQQPFTPSPASPSMEYLRPVAPTSIRSSHIFSPVADSGVLNLNSKDGVAASAGGKGGSISSVQQSSGPPLRPGRSLRTSSPQTL